MTTPKTVDEVELPDPAELLTEMEADDAAKEAAEKAEEAKPVPSEEAKPAEGEKPKPDEAKPEPKPAEAEPAKPKEGEEPDAEQVAKELADKEAEKEAEAELTPEERNARGYATRREIKGRVTEDLEKQPAYTPQTPEEIVEEKGVSPELAAVEALAQQVRRDQIINELTDLNATFNADANRVLRDFPVFDPGTKTKPNPLYDEGFAKQTEDLYAQASGLKFDESKSYIVQASLPLYRFYEFAAAARGSGTKQGTVEGQKATEQMLSAAEDLGTEAAPVTKKDEEGDSFLAGLSGKAGTYAKR